MMLNLAFVLNDRDPYTMEQHKLIDDAIASVQSILEFMKYDPLPFHLY